MANLISNTPKNEFYSISNSWTTLLYSTLLMSGNNLAETYWEKKTMIWLAEHDQTWVGIGLVGIDLCRDIEFSPKEFNNQKNYFLKIARSALEHKVWAELGDRINEEKLTEFLQKWIKVFESLEFGYIDFSKKYHWYREPSEHELDNLCDIHKIRLNKLGQTDRECCLICHDN